MVERQLPKLHTGVRFPSPALFSYENKVGNADLEPKVRTWRQTSSKLIPSPGANRPKNVPEPRSGCVFDVPEIIPLPKCRIIRHNSHQETSRFQP